MSYVFCAQNVSFKSSTRLYTKWPYVGRHFTWWMYNSRHENQIVKNRNCWFASHCRISPLWNLVSWFWLKITVKAVWIQIWAPKRNLCYYSPWYMWWGIFSHVMACVFLYQCYRVSESFKVYAIGRLPWSNSPFSFFHLLRPCQLVLE
jgi:hypothetical protein